MKKISTQSQKNSFLELLKQEDVNKILLSGKFGSGKTTFLHDFFNDNNSFVPIYLFPINYSVASNEDIFEYIKYDILIQFLAWENIDKYICDISNTVAAQVLFMNNPKQFILNILNAYSRVSDVTEKIQELINGTKVLKQELDKYQESAQVDIFLKDLLDQKGSLFENNLITEIIKSIINRWKDVEDNKNKKICLIIDDTERIDPEHIFRILNVFAAHNDIEDESKNKFGFDKIITVSDVQNLQSIFHARYGTETDFYGYISKFHSRSVFYFDFQKTIIDQINTLFRDYRIGNDSFINGYNFFYEDRLKYVLTELLKNQLIIIRMIGKTLNKKFDLSFIEKQSFFYDNIEYNRSGEYIIWLYQILIILFDGKKNLYDALDRMDKLYPFSYEVEDSFRYRYSSVALLLSDIIFLLDRKKIKDLHNKWQKGMEKSDDDILIYTLPNDIDIPYNPTRQFYNEMEFLRDVKNIPIPLWKMLIMAFHRVELIIEKPLY